MKIGPVVLEKMFKEIVDGQQTTDDRRPMTDIGQSQ